MKAHARDHLDVDDIDAVRQWAGQVGEDFIGLSALAEPARLVAVDAFTRAIGVDTDESASRHEEIVRALTEIADDGVLGPEVVDLSLPAVWGPPVTEEEREDAESENLRKAFLARQEVVAKSVSRAAAADLLGMSNQAVTKRLDRGQMVGLKVRGQWMIPSWQLDPNSKDGLLPGIAELNTEFPGGPVALTRWVIQPSADLAGRSPRDLLASNRVDEVLSAAAALTAAGW